MCGTWAENDRSASGDRHVEPPEQSLQVRVAAFVLHQESGVRAASETPSSVMSAVWGWPPKWLPASTSVPRPCRPARARPTARKSPTRQPRRAPHRRLSGPRAAQRGPRCGEECREAPRAESRREEGGDHPPGDCNRIESAASRQKGELPCTARHAECRRANKLEDAGRSEFPSGEGKEMRPVGGIVTGHGSREGTGWWQIPPNCPIHPGRTVLGASTFPCWYWGEHVARACGRTLAAAVESGTSRTTLRSGLHGIARNVSAKKERMAAPGSACRVSMPGPTPWRDTLWATSGRASSRHPRGVGR